ncbi:hypothetical protein ERJ75_001261200 [Trypanosoma vivax]|nr:hypothetical protein ERJ75_001261200 [Trypanosoma vivax]
MCRVHLIASAIAGRAPSRSRGHKPQAVFAMRRERGRAGQSLAVVVRGHNAALETAPRRDSALNDGNESACAELAGFGRRTVSRSGGGRGTQQGERTKCGTGAHLELDASVPTGPPTTCAQTANNTGPPLSVSKICKRAEAGRRTARSPDTKTWKQHGRRDAREIDRASPDVAPVSHVRERLGPPWWVSAPSSC